MLKLVAVSGNKKTGPIAVTYRAGAGSNYGTCPSSCLFNPDPDAGTKEIDREYLDALLEAVPRGGKAFTFSHFDHRLLPEPQPGKTVINCSTDTVEGALGAFRSGRPTVYAAPYHEDAKMDLHDGVRFVRCPAETNERVQCANCGGEKGPICARGDRDFIVKFVAHGTKKRKVDPAKRHGGCYAAFGPTSWQWSAARKTDQEKSDAEILRSWAKSLPYGTMLRHHVAGDIGKEVTHE